MNIFKIRPTDNNTKRSVLKLYDNNIIKFKVIKIYV